MSLTRTLHCFRRGWWVILLTGLMAAFVVYVYTTLNYSPQYRAISRHVVSPNTTLTNETDSLRSLDTLSRGEIIPTFAEIFQSGQILERARTTVGITADASTYIVATYNLPQTNILVITATGPDLATVVELNQAVASSSMEYIAELYPMYSITLLDAPRSSGAPVGSSQERNVIFAFILGSAFGMVVAILIYGDIREIFGIEYDPERPSLNPERNSTKSESDTQSNIGSQEEYPWTV